MKNIKSTGVIINRISLREADRLLTILTPNIGKIVCYARGARNIKSTRITKLNIFYRIKFELIEKNNRKILTHVDVISSYRNNKQNLKDIKRMFEIGELINELVPENQINKEIYDLLVTALENLHKSTTDKYIYRFKLKMLKILGYGNKKFTPQNLDSYIESLIEKPLKTPKIF